MIRVLALLLTVLVAGPALSLQNQKGIFFDNVAPGEGAKKEYEKANFNTRIEMMSESAAPYAGVYIRVFDSSGVMVFKNLCEKPWLFLRLKPGEYHVIGVDREKNQQIARFKIKEGRWRRVKLVWPREVVGY